MLSDIRVLQKQIRHDPDLADIAEHLLASLAFVHDSIQVTKLDKRNHRRVDAGMDEAARQATIQGEGCYLPVLRVIKGDPTVTA